MTKTRTETDFIGEVKIPKQALYGINSVRAVENFPNKSEFNLTWYKSIGLVKLAVYNTYKKYKKAVSNKYPEKLENIKFFDDEIIEALINTATEVSEGKYFDSFIVPAMQGGAGTSINLNINEIIANASLQKLDKEIGDYKYIDPFENANIYQSTNDVIPSALKLAIITLLTDLEEKINNTRARTEQIETKYRDLLRIAYTQLQEAVPSSYGSLFANYSDALSRDWWRVSKCFERIKVVNLGGGAIGTSVAIPQYFTVELVRELQNITRQPITRAENLADVTSNLDSFVEVHAILKSHAVNLEKISSDLRLLSSDISRNKHIKIPEKQTGSSIMPGKVNPVIPEYVISIAHQIYANDVLVSSLSAQGQLDLNAYVPTIGDTILNSLELLISANESLLNNLLADISITSDSKQILYSTSITTALIPYIGYHKAAELAKYMKEYETDIISANINFRYIDGEDIEEILRPENLLKAGFSVKDL